MNDGWMGVSYHCLHHKYGYSIISPLSLDLAFDLKMTAKERLFLFVFLLYSPLVLSEVRIDAYCNYNCTQVKNITMFGLFSAPHASLDFEQPFYGYLYNLENTSNSSSCDSLSPPPPPPASNTSNGSILLLSNYSHCMRERILLARAVGYDMILSYTEDDTNTTITKSIINTGIPIALIQYKHLQTILGWVVSGNNTNTSIAVTVSIWAVLIVLGAIFSIIILVGLATLFIWLCYRSICCCEEEDRDLDSRRRQGHVESIELRAQVPLGRDGVEKFPKREYAGNDKERDTNCCICSEDFKSGQEVRELPCQHLFHPSCIDEWMNHSLVCPLCRLDLSGDNNNSGSSVL